MGASMMPEPPAARIARNVAALRAQGATEHDVEAYLTEHEGLTPSGPAAPVSDGKPHGSSGTWGDDLGDKVRGTVNAVGQGMLAGFADEVNAKMTPGDYETNLRLERADMASFARAHPVINGAARIGGTIASASLPIVRGLGIVGGGALFGGLNGAGEADGSMKDRAMGAGVGAGVGAASGAALKYVAAPVARAGYDLAKQGAAAISDTPFAKALTDFLAAHPPGLSTHNVGAGNPNAGALGPGSSPPPNATRGVSGGFTSRVEDLFPRSADDRAKMLMLEKFAADKKTVPDMISAATTSTKPMAVGDLAGENTLGLQRAAKSVPGEGKEAIPAALYGRQAGMQDRLVNDAVELAGTGQRTNIPKAIETFGAARDARAADDFGALRKLPPVNRTTFEDLLNTPAGQQAAKQADRIAQNTVGGRSTAPGLVNASGGRPMSFEDVHNIKLAFDDMLAGNPSTPLDAGGLGKNNARVIRELKNEWLTRADKAFPGYDAARQNFAAPSEIMNAMQDGKDFFSGKMSTDELGLTMDKMSDPARRAFVQSGMEQLAQKIQSGMSTFDKTRKVILPTEMQQRIRLLFPDDQSFTQFISRAEEEARMKHSLNFTQGGSNTVDKAGEIADMGGGKNPWVQEMIHRGPVRGSLSALTNSTLANRAAGVTTETANALSPLFTKGMGGSKQELIDMLTDFLAAQSREAQRGQTRSIVSRPFTSAAGGAASSFTSPPPRR